MPPFSENRDAFMSPAEFAQAATVGGSALFGIFDHQYVEAFESQGEGPVLLCLTADLPGSTGEGTAVVTGAKTYQVIGMKPDGTGFTLLVLKYISG